MKSVVLGLVCVGLSACASPVMPSVVPSVPVQVRTYRYGDARPVLARVSVEAGGRLRRYTTDAQGLVLVDVPTSTAIMVSASADGYQVSAVGGVVQAAGERWTFYLFPVE